ncbi:MAG: ABC transporter substrate-binding protein [Candidatus Binatia bacterium]
MKRRADPGLKYVALFLLGVLAQPPPAAPASLPEQIIAKAKMEGTLVVAGSNASEFRDDLKGFQKKYPFITVKAFEANTTMTVNRVITEAKAGRLSIDVVDIGADGANVLAGRGLLAKREFPHLKDFASKTQPRSGLYVTIALNQRVQGIYNTDLVSRTEIPRSWGDMLDPKWTKTGTMLSRSAEEFPAKLAWLWRKGKKLNWKRSFDFFTKLFQNTKPGIGRGYSGITQRVAAGEGGIFWFGVTAPAARLKHRGAPLGLIGFPRFPVTFRSEGITKGAPHPNAAWLLIDYLTSPEGQQEYTDKIHSAFPLNHKAKDGRLSAFVKKEGITLDMADILRPDEINEVFSEEVLKKSEKFFFKLLGIQ